MSSCVGEGAKGRTSTFDVDVRLCGVCHFVRLTRRIWGETVSLIVWIEWLLLCRRWKYWISMRDLLRQDVQDTRLVEECGLFIPFPFRLISQPYSLVPPYTVRRQHQSPMKLHIQQSLRTAGDSRAAKARKKVGRWVQIGPLRPQVGPGVEEVVTHYSRVGLSIDTQGRKNVLCILHSGNQLRTIPSMTVGGVVFGVGTSEIRTVWGPSQAPCSGFSRTSTLQIVQPACLARAMVFLATEKMKLFSWQRKHPPLRVLCLVIWLEPINHLGLPWKLE